MQIINSLDDIRQTTQEWKQKKYKIALVPTMGNLHQGHLALVKAALELTPYVIVSIFVNPLQFGPNEDYAEYPRTLTKDIELLETLNVPLLFTPHTNEFYPQNLGQHTFITVPVLSSDLCSITRPGFFQGVGTVVIKFFNLIQPDFAFFGEKDYQQMIIIKKMITDLFLPIEIKSIAIVREEDGLAMSSRNNYLSVTERKQAPQLFATLSWMKNKILEEKLTTFDILIEDAKLRLATAGFKPDYIAVRRKEDLQHPKPKDKNLIILAAAYLGKTRLIDNLEV